MCLIDNTFHVQIWQRVIFVIVIEITWLLIAHLHDTARAFRGAHLSEWIGPSGNALIYIGKV
jgi:hypothetical protein